MKKICTTKYKGHTIAVYEVEMKGGPTAVPNPTYLVERLYIDNRDVSDIVPCPTAAKGEDYMHYGKQYIDSL